MVDAVGPRRRRGYLIARIYELEGAPGDTSGPSCRRSSSRASWSTPRTPTAPVSSGAGRRGVPAPMATSLWPLVLPRQRCGALGRDAITIPHRMTGADYRRQREEREEELRRRAASTGAVGHRTASGLSCCRASRRKRRRAGAPKRPTILLPGATPNTRPTQAGRRKGRLAWAARVALGSRDTLLINTGALRRLLSGAPARDARHVAAGAVHGGAGRAPRR